MGFNSGFKGLKTWEGRKSYVVTRWLRRDESCRENQNTFYFQKRSFPQISYRLWYDVIYLTAVGLTPGSSSTVHIYTQTIHRTT